MSRHVIIYVPGLGDSRTTGQALAVGLWRIWGVRSELCVMYWNRVEPFDAKLERLLARIDTWHQQGKTVSLVGVSAGASAVLAAYSMRQYTIHRVVLICGKVRNRETISQHTYRLNPAFRESMLRIDRSLEGLGPAARSRITSIKPFRDPTVPPADTMIPGAQSITIPTSGHAWSITACITLGTPLVIHAIRRKL